MQGGLRSCTSHSMPWCQPSKQFIKLEVVCTVMMVFDDTQPSGGEGGAVAELVV